MAPKNSVQQNPLGLSCLGWGYEKMNLNDHQMNTGQGKFLTILSVILAGVVVAYFSQEFAHFFEQDNCIDHSGAYDYLTGICTVPQGENYAPLFSRAKSYWSWMYLVGFQFLIGIGSFKLFQYLFKFIIR